MYVSKQSLLCNHKENLPLECLLSESVMPILPCTCSAEDVRHFAGSGSSYLYGFLDQAWKQNMTHKEAEV